MTMYRCAIASWLFVTLVVKQSVIGVAEDPWHKECPGVRLGKDLTDLTDGDAADAVRRCRLISG